MIQTRGSGKRRKEDAILPVACAFHFLPFQKKPGQNSIRMRSLRCEAVGDGKKIVGQTRRQDQQGRDQQQRTTKTKRSGWSRKRWTRHNKSVSSDAVAAGWRTASDMTGFLRMRDYRPIYTLVSRKRTYRRYFCRFEGIPGAWGKRVAASW